jgi:hypothetical protein
MNNGDERSFDLSFKEHVPINWTEPRMLFNGGDVFHSLIWIFDEQF